MKQRVLAPMRVTVALLLAVFASGLAPVTTAWADKPATTGPPTTSQSQKPEDTGPPQTTPATPPAVTPPETTPPVVTPPEVTPPQTTPPETTPPVTAPPVVVPPVVTPPTDDSSQLPSGTTLGTVGNLQTDPLPGTLTTSTDDTDTTTVKKVAYCHATGSETNPYVYLDTSVSAFYKSGHNDHSGDIVAPFSYVKHGQVITFAGLNWDTEHQAIFNNHCNLPNTPPTQQTVTPAAVVPTYATCSNTTTGFTITRTEGVRYKVTVNGKTTTAKPGFTAVPVGTTVTVTAQAKNGYVLATGATASWAFTFNAVNPSDCDLCSNLPNVQTVVPNGYDRDSDGTCFELGRGGDTETPPTIFGGTTLTRTFNVTNTTTTTPAVTLASAGQVAAASQLANTGSSDTALVILLSLTVIAFAVGTTISTRSSRQQLR